MKYVKYGMATIAAQTINAKCCCGNSNNNNNNNGGENNKSEEDIFIDEIVEFFNVTKDRVIIKKKMKATDAGGYYTQEFLTNDEKTTADNKLIEAKKVDKNLKIYQFTKLNLKSKEAICVILISKNSSPNKAKLDDTNPRSIVINFKSNEEIDIYSVRDGYTGVFRYYRKKKS